MALARPVVLALARVLWQGASPPNVVPPLAVTLAAALAERCRAGVAVKVLLDGVGTLDPDHESVLRAGRATRHGDPGGRAARRPGSPSSA